MTGTDIGTLLLGMAALLTAVGSLWRTKSNRRDVNALRHQLTTLRRHLRIVVAALATAERENHRLQTELAELRPQPIVRSQRRRTDDAPPH